MRTLSAPATTGRLPALGDGQLEALKWIALASMFLDHVGRHLLGYGYDSWVFAGGRVAFPMFALVLGLNLARPGERSQRAARTARRLALWGAVSVLPSIWARGEPQTLNVLVTLGLGAVLCWSLASERHAALRLAAALLALLASRHVEFGMAGVLLVPAVFLWQCGQAWAAAPGALCLLLVASLNGRFGGLPALLATVAPLPIAVAVRGLPLRVPRVGRAFYWIYPLHLALIGAWKWAAPVAG